MEPTEDFAEILGMFAADGCLQEGYICMWGNIYEDQDYYNEVVCPMFSRVFKREIKAHEKKSNSVYGFYLCSKEIVKLFKELGFTNNKTYDVNVPKIIMKSNNPKIHAAFIRGFADCDGYLSFMKRKGKYREFKLKYNTYPRVGMNGVSKEIIKSIGIMLRNLKVKHTMVFAKSRKLNEKDQYVIIIRGENRLENWMEKIGFHNSSKYNKYQIWKKYGMVPSKSTHAQRKLIMEGKLDPFLINN